MGILYTILMIIGSLLLLGMGGWIAFKIIKKKKKEKEIIKDEIPKEVLEDFNIAERRLQEEIKNGKFKSTSPYTILWELANKRTTEEDKIIGGRCGHTNKSEERIGDERFHELSGRGQDIQNGIVGINQQEHSSNTKPNRKRSTNFFSRFRKQ